MGSWVESFMQNLRICDYTPLTRSCDDIIAYVTHAPLQLRPILHPARSKSFVKARSHCSRLNIATGYMMELDDVHGTPWNIVEPKRT